MLHKKVFRRHIRVPLQLILFSLEVQECIALCVNFQSKRRSALWKCLVDTIKNILRVKKMKFQVSNQRNQINISTQTF